MRAGLLALMGAIGAEGFGTDAEEGGGIVPMEGLADLVEQVVSGDLLFHAAAEDGETDAVVFVHPLQSQG